MSPTLCKLFRLLQSLDHPFLCMVCYFVLVLPLPSSFFHNCMYLGKEMKQLLGSYLPRNSSEGREKNDKLNIYLERISTFLLGRIVWNSSMD